MQKKWLYLIPLSLIIIGCGGTENDTTTTNKGEGSIDLRTYLEKEDSSKNYQLNKKNTQNQFYTEVTTVTSNKIERKIAGFTNTIINIEDKKLINIDVSDEGNINTSSYRHIDIGDTLFSTDINSTKTLKVGTQEVGTEKTLGTNSCKLTEQLDKFSKGSNSYTGDIIKVKCTKATTITTKVKDEFVGTVNHINGTVDSIDTSYYYQKKDIGLIAHINDDCIPTNMTYPDDSTACSDEQKTYSYIYYLGN